MSESNPLVVSDRPPLEPEPQAEAGNGPAPARPQAKVSVALALTALGMSVALAAAAYFTWDRLQQLSAEQARIGQQLNDRMAALDSSLTQFFRQRESQRERVAGRLQALGDEQRDVADRVRMLGALVAHGEQAWRLAEVEYLLRIASQRALIQRDVETARAALHSADARLRELADPHYAAVREQIAAEVGALEAVAQVDTGGIAAELHALQNAMDKLPVAGVAYQPRPDSGLPEGDETQAEGDFEWRQLPGRVWASLSRLLRVREHNRPIEPMLPPDRDFYLRENLKLQLSAAQVAVVDRDSAAYREALATARDWLNSYFDLDSGAVVEAVSQLEALAALDIDPDLPDVSGSLRRLREQMKVAEQQSARPSVAKPAAGDEQPDTANTGVEVEAR